jgi:L-ribulose-5-phosphate 3-epimerase
MTFPTRRQFLATSSALAAATLLGRTSPAAQKDPLYRISLAQWSLHRSFFDGKLDPLDFARITKEEFGIEGIEYVNQFYKDKAKDAKYIGDLKQRAADHGVKSLLIMCDGEGRLGDPDETRRKEAVENHYKWVEAAAELGCHSIRVNAASEGSFEEQQKLAADGLARLTTFAEQHNQNVIVENHGGLSSNGEWLAGVMQRVDHPHCGTLPDFGNFKISSTEWYDRYDGVRELMPWAKAVSAKSHYFADGREVYTDYQKMMQIVLDAGYHGWVGIEWEGSQMGEYEGIQATKKLLEDVRETLSA